MHWFVISSYSFHLGVNFAVQIDELCGNDATTANHRTFQLVDDDTTSALGNITNAYAATFIDLDEDVSSGCFRPFLLRS